MNVVSGTSGGVWAPEVARLNRAGWAYAERYNRLLLRKLRRARRPRARPLTSIVPRMPCVGPRLAGPLNADVRHPLITEGNGF